jgi:hypothetical protein
MSSTFDGLLLQAIDRTLRYTFGDVSTDVIYDYLEKKGCGVREIPQKLDVFSEGLRNVIGTGSSRSFLGVASIVEETILEILYTELKIEFNRQNPASFEDQVNKLREIYNNRRETVTQTICKGSSEENDSPFTQLTLQSRGGETC